jgi:hypothetical protein
LTVLQTTATAARLQSAVVTAGRRPAVRLDLRSVTIGSRISTDGRHFSAALPSGEGSNGLRIPCATKTVLLAHTKSDQIRESDSGVPGRNDLLEPKHDHGIMWALNTYWRARQEGPDLYAEFEFVELARSAQEFTCKIGIIPIPKAVVSRVIDTLLPESLELMLTATKAECERRSSGRASGASR